ncbi:conserved hypothetical protein [Roseovarius sp. EC-HK134]|jgi:hypothetical protein|uniref:hypothetical protein n=1 Tax=Roseovarius TaxID=74030 RepID=UPI0001556851|nr:MULTISPECIES: hypothetical protein [Roseovarius]AWZ19412.1 Hypothetical protein RAK1035_0701 [Roseovarius sp. AK1035]EDM33587.1 hypothetical protein RTM1035_16422 [Roseovarius sp. TM1035]VVT06637.1 conserved hypothetical protein [Roseovarius sp. EC-HK134]VVT07371.1 conserved hypothetical protein [Roseovarius sp. EC-SD190]|tara:strand:+ start:307 stop:783 length:477 start_codon:yes stop_codon:yes gene_type:complete
MSFKNKVFDLLTQDGEDDIEALAAYGLYKRHKRMWAKDFEAENGKPPTPEDDAQFARAVCTTDQLARYRKDAQDILIAFANQSIEDATPQIEVGAITTRIEKAAASIEQQSSFKQQIVSGLISTLITTAALILLAIGIRLFGIDVIDGVRELLPVHSP